MTEGQQKNDSVQIDHILIGVARLEEGIEEMESLTGIRPMFGGEHPAYGTHNALLSLGNCQYLELIAPRPDAVLAGGFEFLAECAGLAPVSWAIATKNGHRTADKLVAAGYAVTDLSPGSRQTTDGSVLKWRTFQLAGMGINGPPFFIEWESSTPHPSETSPAGCELLSFELAHPSSSRLQTIVNILQLDATIRPALSPLIRIRLNSPKGEVRLGGLGGSANP